MKMNKQIIEKINNKDKQTIINVINTILDKNSKFEWEDENNELTNEKQAIDEIKVLIRKEARNLSDERKKEVRSIDWGDLKKGKITKGESPDATKEIKKPKE